MKKIKKEKIKWVIIPHLILQKKKIMLTHTEMQIAPPRSSSSLYFSLPNKSKHLTSWTKKFWDEIQTPPKGSHFLRGFSPKVISPPNIASKHGLYLAPTHMNSQSLMNISLLHIPHLAISYM